MSKRLYLLFTFLFVGNLSLLYAQHVVEVQKPDLSETYLTVTEKAARIKGQNPEESIRLLNEAMSQIDGDYERFQITFFHLFFIYSGMGRFQEALDVLIEGQKEGFFYPITTGERKYPSFVDVFKGFEGFDGFLEQNDRLKDEAQKDANFEYIVQVPDDYNEGKTYPLLLVLTGGWGSHIGLTEDWHSAKLQSDYVVAYLQGIRYRGSFLRSYNRENLDNVLEAYKQIVEKYAVDTSRVVLGGQSAGGRRALTLALDELLPATGLLLAFPVVPRDADFEKIDKAVERNVRTVFITGEKDRRFEQQKESAALFDKQGLPVRFVAYPEKGHEFPDDFPKQIDHGLDFIFQE